MTTSPALSPIDAAARLAGRRGRVLLHSARDDDGLGRWSFVAAEPHATLIARGRSLVILDRDGRPARRFTADPLDAAEAFLRDHGCTLEPRAGGAPEPRVIGYLGYELARVIERLPGGASVDHAEPDVWLAAYGAVARWSDGEPEIIGPDPAARAALAGALARPAPPSLAPSFRRFTADDDAAHHRARVERVHDHLAAGDAHEVNLARRLVARIAAPGEILALYAALAEVAPAPYGALLEADGVTLVSGSPERFLTSVGDRIESRPIEGGRAHGPAASAAPNHAAEHRRIVDQVRDDLERIAEIGSVSVDGRSDSVEPPAPVHQVWRVSARPRPGTGYARLLRATFPGGSITGAPKLRAMQLIDEIEPVGRGPACGALGYFGARGAFDLAIATRIGVVSGRELRVHVGGGIVADSDAATDLAEAERETAGWIAALDRLRTRG